MKTLEERLGRPVQVSQACIESIVSGPKLVPGENVSLLNYSEKLNATTKTLQGDVKREASVDSRMTWLQNGTLKTTKLAVSRGPHACRTLLSL